MSKRRNARVWRVNRTPVAIAQTMDERSRSLTARLFPTSIKTATTPMYDTALIPNANPAPKAATAAPAMMGPTALATPSRDRVECDCRRVHGSWNEVR
jgi:hypothetical protein